MEDFVTYEVAKKLNGKGFRFNKDYRLDRFFMANEINTPTIAQVLKWLREEKKIHIDITIWDGKYIAMIIYTNIKDDNIEHCNETICMEENKYDSYESAALAGIEYVLDNLI